MVTANNQFYPVLSDHPIRRLQGGDDYYIVNSSFVLCPGVPIFTAEIWHTVEQIGNILNRKSWLPSRVEEISRGILHRRFVIMKLFYMIITNVSYGGKFIVTAKSRRSPGQIRIILVKKQGIDPSLFLMRMEKCYYCGTNPAGRCAI